MRGLFTLRDLYRVDFFQGEPNVNPCMGVLNPTSGPIVSVNCIIPIFSLEIRSHRELTLVRYAFNVDLMPMVVSQLHA